MTRKLIFFDIDNTLVSHVGKSHIPEATIETIGLLKRSGHTVAVATARNLSMTRKTAEDLGIGLMVCCDGACVRHGDRVLHEQRLSSDFLRIFRERMSANPDDFSALDADYVYTGRNSDSFREYLVGQAGFDCRRSPDELKQACMAYAFCPTDLRHDEVEAFEAPYYTEYLPRGVGKWSGILRAIDGLNFAPENIIAVGDGDNDVEMLKNASFGIAVAKATPRALAAADMVTSDIDEGGIREAFRKLKLI